MASSHPIQVVRRGFGRTRFGTAAWGWLAVIDQGIFYADKSGMMLRAVIAPLTLLFVASTGWAAERQPSTADTARMMAELQASHTSANAPPDASFMVLLQRDVRAYLVAKRLPSKSLEIEPLRKGATQSGVSYPKYYVWIRAADEAGHHIAGAMRIAAIDRVRFSVTDFTPAASIQSDPTSLASIYPALLIPAIRQHASRVTMSASGSEADVREAAERMAIS